MKKITSLLLTISIILTTIITAGAVNYGEEYSGMPVTTYEQTFNDVPISHWAFNSISEMYNRGVISGYPNGNFYPDNNVTRAEFAKIMTNASGLQISQPTKKDFEDVATDAWYAPYIHASYPYLSGYHIYGGNYYKPDTPALREDIAVALVKLKGYDTFGADESILSTMFKDYESISVDARKYVAVALERGLVSGYDDDTFRGQSSISRAEATIMLWRAYQYGNDNKTFDVVNPPSTQIIITPEPIITIEPTVTPTPEIVETFEPNAIPTIEPTAIPTEAPVEKPYIIDTVASYNSSKFSTSDGENIYFYDNADGIIYMVNDEKSVYIDLNSFELPDENYVLIKGEVESLYYDGRLIASIMFYGGKNSGGLTDIKCFESRLVDISDPKNPIIISDDRGDYKYTMSNGNYIMNDYIYDSDNNRMKYIGSDDYNISIYTVKGSTIYCITYSNKVMQYDFGSSKWITLRDIYNECEEEYSIYTALYEDKFYLMYKDGSIVTCDLNGNLTKSDFNAINDCEIVDFLSYPNKSYLNDHIMYITDSGLYFFDSISQKIRVIKER